MNEKTVGVIGAGSFGTAIANLLGENQRVLLYERKTDVAEQIRQTRKVRGYDLHERVEISTSFEQVAKDCFLIFPAIPSLPLARSSLCFVLLACQHGPFAAVCTRHNHLAMHL
jgi:glycerol-3-phosphate dehydrogenase